MPRLQRNIIALSLFTALGVALYPPWEARITRAEGLAITQVYHAPIFDPPAASGGGAMVVTYHVSVSRLLTYWAVILMATVAVLLIVPSKVFGSKPQ